VLTPHLAPLASLRRIQQESNGRPDRRAHVQPGATIERVATLLVRFHFHGELKDLLAPSRRNGDFLHPAGSTDTVKHVIESLGVPHTEIGSVARNGILIPLTSELSENDVIDVFPHPAVSPAADPRFVADGHLGRLAAYLRMLGFDTWYQRDADDITLAHVSSSEGRILLTRDIGLLKRKEVERGRFIRPDKPHDQLRTVVIGFGLLPHIAPFTRCMDCNGLLLPASKEEVLHLLPPHTRATKEQFSRCPECGKVYWRGSHHARMLQWIEQLGV
jgi:uncharacterized protein with PIN domain